MTVSLKPPGRSSSHADLDDLLADDHLVYALLAGRAGGQVLNGGTASGDKLELRGTTDVERGVIHIRSQLNFDIAQALSTPEDTGGAALNFVGNVSSSTAGMLMSVIRQSWTWNVLARAGDQVFFDNRNINYAAAASGVDEFNFASIQSTTQTDDPTAVFPKFGCLSWKPLIRSQTSSLLTTRSVICIDAQPQLKTSNSGGIMRVDNAFTGFKFEPKWSVVTGGTINYKDVTGFEFHSPSLVGGQPDGGVKRIGDYIGMWVEDLDATLTINSFGVAIGFQCELSVDADRWMFRNDGGAKSSFGLGSALFGTVGAEEFEIGWDGTKTLEFKGSVDAGGNVALDLNVEEIGFYGVTPVVRAGATDEIKASLVALGLLQGTSATPLDLDGGALSCAAITATGDVEIDGALNHDGSTAGFYAATPVTQASALTTVLTSITHSGPGTPDYAIATPIEADETGGGGGSSWGFSTQDEFETVISVVANLQARQNELETVLANLGLTA